MRRLPDTAFLIKESAFTLSHMLPLLLIYWRNVPPDVKQWCRPQPFLDTSSPPMLSHWIPCHQVALNALRNPPVPNGSGSIEKSTVVGLPVRAITDMSKLKISAEVVVSVMSFPNFSMSTTDRLCGANLHGIWHDALWGTDVTMGNVADLSLPPPTDPRWNFNRSVLDFAFYESPMDPF